VKLDLTPTKETGRFAGYVDLSVSHEDINLDLKQNVTPSK